MKKWYIVMKTANVDSIYIVELSEEERAAVSTLINEAIPIETNSYSGHLSVSRNGYSTRDEATIVAANLTPGRICWDDYEEI